MKVIRDLWNDCTWVGRFTAFPLMLLTLVIFMALLAPGLAVENRAKRLTAPVEAFLRRLLFKTRNK